jgi:predicted DCC family thiol-disulfide oxidoreductase YuxK
MIAIFMAVLAEVSQRGSTADIGSFRAYVASMGELLVWYDGACPLCRREIALMRRLDGKRAITFVDVARDSADCPLDRAEVLARFHALEDGRLLSGAAAFAAMWRALPWLRPLGLAAQNGLVLALLERLYRLFLRVRPRLQRAAWQLEARGSS